MINSFNIPGIEGELGTHSFEVEKRHNIRVLDRKQKKSVTRESQGVDYKRLSLKSVLLWYPPWFLLSASLFSNLT